MKKQISVGPFRLDRVPLSLGVSILALALFDFDGTLTTEDTFTQFVVFATPRWRLIFGYALLWPAIFLYKRGVLSASKMRQLVIRVAFWRKSHAKLESLAAEYVQKYLPKVMREKAVTEMLRHQQRGDRVIIVSASISAYLRIWAQQHGVELLCSELGSNNGRCTGKYLHGDCSGHNKVAAINRAVDVESYTTIYAYGDTEEDIPMLNLANERIFKGKRLSGSHQF